MFTFQDYKEMLLDLKSELSEVCTDIGCSGMSTDCPGDSKCSILRKLARFCLKDQKDGKKNKN